MQQFLKRVFGSAVAWSFAATTLRFGSVFIVLPIILRRIPPEELGLWYVFLTMGSLAGLVDFGFAQTINRVTAYLWAGALELLPLGVAPPITNEGKHGPTKPNLPLLSRLIATINVYYIGLAAASLLLLLTLGSWSIYSKTRDLHNVQSLRLAFAVYSLGIALNLLGSMWLYTLNGVNRVRESFQLSTFCLAENFAISITGLLAGLRIWALVIASFIAGLSERMIGRYLFRKYAPIERLPFDKKMIVVLWPNAWRTGAVMVGAFMVMQANTLICSGFLGLKATASYGLTLQAVMLLMTVSSVWVTVKFPLINQLRAQGRLAEIAMVFRGRIILSLATYLVGGAVLILFGQAILNMLHAKTPFLSMPILAAMLIIYLLEAHHSLYGGLVFSENVNPFVIPALASGSATVLLSIILTPKLGVWGMLVSQGVVQLSFNNWWTVLRGIRGLEMDAKTYWSGFVNSISTMRISGIS